jgi:hypothetical protein
MGVEVAERICVIGEGEDIGGAIALMGALSAHFGYKVLTISSRSHEIVELRACHSTCLNTMSHAA